MPNPHGSWHGGRGPAIFRRRLAGALFASEVLYRSPEFESEVIIPAALSSITAYCTFGMVFGWAPLFSLPPEVLNALTFQNPVALAPYFVLALFVAVLAMLYTRFVRLDLSLSQASHPSTLQTVNRSLFHRCRGLSLY